MKVFLFLGNDGPRRRAGFEAAVADWRTKVSVMDFDSFDLKEPGQALAALGCPCVSGRWMASRRLVVWKNAHVLHQANPRDDLRGGGVCAAYASQRGAPGRRGDGRSPQRQEGNADHPDPAPGQAVLHRQDQGVFCRPLVV